VQKRVLAGLPLLVAALIFLGLWIANKNTTPSWRVELEQYIAYKVNLSNSPITIQRTVQASQPWKFSADMSSGTFGDCFYFEVNYCYNVDETPPSPPILFPPDEVLFALVKTTTSSPLPFPPDDVWCALVKTSIDGKETSWVVYIAKHQDLYNADWIVHESSKSIADPQLKDDLTNIGCESLLKPGE
jgi:hypothetical protein